MYDESGASVHSNILVSGTSSLIHSLDVAGFWSDDRLKVLGGSVAAQISVAARLNTPEVKTTIVDCLVTLIEAIQSDTILKAMNLNILMNTRSEDSRVRLLALTCGEALWRGHGGKLMGM